MFFLHFHNPFPCLSDIKHSCWKRCINALFIREQRYKHMDVTCNTGCLSPITLGAATWRKIRLLEDSWNTSEFLCFCTKQASLCISKSIMKTKVSLFTFLLSIKFIKTVLIWTLHLDATQLTVLISLPKISAQYSFAPERSQHKHNLQNWSLFLFLNMSMYKFGSGGGVGFPHSRPCGFTSLKHWWHNSG